MFKSKLFLCACLCILVSMANPAKGDSMFPPGFKDPNVPVIEDPNLIIIEPPDDELEPPIKIEDPNLIIIEPPDDELEPPPEPKIPDEEDKLKPPTEPTLRQLKEQTPKVMLTVDPVSLRLKWNGDQGQAGRGDGEVYVQTWIHWPAKVEDKNNPQHRELGPLGGKAEFLTGTIVDSDDPRYLIEPAIVYDGKFAMLYKNTADCPIPNYIVVDSLVWDDDTNAGLMAFVNIITGIIDAAVGKIPGVSIATELVSNLIDKLTKGGKTGKTMLGRAEKVKVEICTEEEISEFCECEFIDGLWVSKTVRLKNIVELNLWDEMEFKKDGGYITLEDESTFTRAIDIIEAIEPIGYLDLDISLDKLNKTSSHEVNEGAAGSKEIRHADIGQHDESTIGSALKLGAALLPLPEPISTESRASSSSGLTLGELRALSSDPILRKYSMFLDVDNNLATGAQGFPYDGAEFELAAEFDNSYSPAYKLMQYNSDTDVFEEVPGGIYDGAINIDRAAIFLQVKLSTLGNPVGPIAAWGVVVEQGVVVDVLPEHPTQLALGLTPSYTSTGVPPMVVTTNPPHDAIDVDRETPIEVRFSKSMARPEAQAAFSMNPPVAGSFAWQGNTVIFIPSGLLEPMTQYEVTIDPNATDRVGTLFDGNGDLTPGDSFTWEFITEALPLFSCDVNGLQQDMFYEGEPIYVTGIDFVPLSEVEIYIVRHARAEMVPGAELIDVTDTASTLAIIDAQGILPPTFVGSVTWEGEYNIIVDVNSNVLFDPSTDRCDRTGIGFAVFPEYEPLADGLVAYYGLENNVQDGSGNGHHGELRGSPTYVPGPAGYGTAMHFNGTIRGNYVDLGTFNPSAATGQLSIALWAKWDGLTNYNYQALIAKRDRWSATGMMWHIETYRYTGLFRFGSHKDSNVGISSPLPVGEWTHVALTFDGTTAKFYINGELDASGRSSLGPKTDAFVVLAAVEGTGARTPGACPFNGALDEIHIYDRPLTQAEILYLAGP